MALVSSSFKQRVRGPILNFAGLHGAQQVEPPFEAIQVEVPKSSLDPYALNRAREEAIGGPAVMARLTYEHPENIRARRVAALREELSKPVQARFPHEGRSDRVYTENRR